MLLDLSGRLKVITVSLNGEPRQFDSPLKVAQLLDQLGLTGKRLAVEKNGEIVPKSQHAETAIENGDVLEIVVAVGGG
ncbi:sulfur carrier protein [Sulfuritortus calidifontis]|uniref:Sulfur carrier protein n=1 Tax=Sulfuritortus calidifontis TaxID=1914471 RepID=A0A4R3JUA3_9PROT|nr:sulfur carrier protein [Sulfuritortus calidifontis]